MEKSFYFGNSWAFVAAAGAWISAGATGQPTDFTWTGAISDRYEDASNWSPQAVPDSYGSAGPARVLLDPLVPNPTTVTQTFHTVAGIETIGPVNALLVANGDLIINSGAQVGAGFSFEPGLIDRVTLQLNGGSDLFMVREGVVQRSAILAGAASPGLVPRVVAQTPAPHGERLTFIDSALISAATPLVLAADPGAGFAFAGTANGLSGNVRVEAPATITQGVMRLQVRGINDGEAPSLRAPLRVGDGSRLEVVADTGAFEIPTRASTQPRQYATIHEQVRVAPGGNVSLPYDPAVFVGNGEVLFEGAGSVSVGRNDVLPMSASFFSNLRPTSTTDISVFFSTLHYDEFLAIAGTLGQGTMTAKFAALRGGTNGFSESYLVMPDDRTVTFEEVLDAGPTDLQLNLTDSRLNLQGGTFINPNGGPVAPGDTFEAIDGATLLGGLDPSGLRDLNANGSVINGPTIADGPILGSVSLAGATNDIGGEPHRSFGQPTTLDNVEIVDGAVVSVRGVTVRNGLRLDGTLLNTGAPGLPYAEFEGTQTLDGDGTLNFATSLGANAFRGIRSRGGDLTVGPGIVATGGSLGGGDVLDAEGDVVWHGTIDVASSRGHYSMAAATLDMHGTILGTSGTFSFAGERLTLRPSAEFRVVSPRLPYRAGDNLADPYVRAILMVTGPDDSDASVGGRIEVGGALRLSLPGALNRFERPTGLTLGEGFAIVDASGGVTGTFGSVEILRSPFEPDDEPLIPDGLTLAVVYDATQVSAVVALIGDANLNGTVEQGDLNAVLNNWGRRDGVSWVTGDLDQDGTVAQGDLNAVLNHWGSSASPDFTGFAVPEPASVAVFLLGLAGWRRR
ncbi:MAG: PEP-CTERM sorting domain-containing protein [Planctomycetota bacterium]